MGRKGNWIYDSINYSARVHTACWLDRSWVLGTNRAAICNYQGSFPNPTATPPRSPSHARPKFPRKKKILRKGQLPPGTNVIIMPLPPSNRVKYVRPISIFPWPSRHNHDLLLTTMTIKLFQCWREPKIFDHRRSPRAKNETEFYVRGSNTGFLRALYRRYFILF